MNKKKLFYYIYDKKLVEISKNIPHLRNRAAILQSLIASYNLLSHCEICTCDEATEENLLSFHSAEYVKCLKKIQMASDLEKMTDADEVVDCNLGYDCPLFEKIFDFAKLMAGSSLTAARKLISQTLQVKKKVQPCIIENPQPKSYLKFKSVKRSVRKTEEVGNLGNLTVRKDILQTENLQGKNERVAKSKINKQVEFSVCSSDLQPIAINWFGGWHHAQRDEAGGFCYINDIVIAIQYLLKFCKRILYIDLDIHHGNGVENAFLFSSRVMTFSLHKFEPGFYPATGSLNNVGEGNGKFYTINVPLKSGITDENYFKIFERLFYKIIKKYQPHCIVVQCGADCLAGDPLGGFNMTPVGMGKCLRVILDEMLPTLVLGGGGYNIINTAKCWAYLTSVILDSPISNDIPENPFLNLYGPGFELAVEQNLRKDENSCEYIDNLMATIFQNLDHLPENSNL